MGVNGFWKGRPVLVTGATGLLGSWLTHSLVKMGADLVCLLAASALPAADWGTLKGRFVYDGKVPAKKMLVVEKPECKMHAMTLRDESLMVGPKGQLQSRGKTWLFSRSDHSHQVGWRSGSQPHAHRASLHSQT